MLLKKDIVRIGKMRSLPIAHSFSFLCLRVWKEGFRFNLDHKDQNI